MPSVLPLHVKHEVSAHEAPAPSPSKASHTSNVHNEYAPGTLDDSNEPLNERDGYAAPYPNRWASIREHIREPAAEAFGTFILVLFGTGVNCQNGVGTAATGAPQADPASIALAWGAGLSLGAWVAGGISGGHINPAVTLAMATFRGFSWKKVPGYILAQYFGAWLGAIVVYANYFHAINISDDHQFTVPGTAAFFGAYALDYLPSANAFFDEFLGTFILVFVIFAVTDKYRDSPSTGLLPLALFLVFIGITAAFGMQTAFALNPARDFGPRVMTAMVGYGRAVFNYRSQYWLWCTTLAPILGALTAAAVYDTLMYRGSDSIVNRRNSSARAYDAQRSAANDSTGRRASTSKSLA
ncbi:aquaporin [Peniophora sp. CONT]|nr:aquaporin [Peniophora sp. CONT]